MNNLKKIIKPWIFWIKKVIKIGIHKTFPLRFYFHWLIIKFDTEIFVHYQWVSKHLFIILFAIYFLGK